jgi:hypothetical protein
LFITFSDISARHSSLGGRSLSARFPFPFARQSSRSHVLVFQIARDKVELLFWLCSCRFLWAEYRRFDLHLSLALQKKEYISCEWRAFSLYCPANTLPAFHPGWNWLAVG